MYEYKTWNAFVTTMIFFWWSKSIRPKPIELHKKRNRKFCDFLQNMSKQDKKSKQSSTFLCTSI